MLWFVNENNEKGTDTLYIEFREAKYSKRGFWTKKND